MDKLLRLLGWYRQLNAVRALVRMILAIARKIQTTNETSNNPTAPSTEANIQGNIGTEMDDADDADEIDDTDDADDVMDMDLDDIAAIQAFNNRFKLDS